jgi:GT2 family glycosyltransferase
VLDVVIPVFGQPEMLQRCLTAVDETKGDLALKVFLVDDASPDPEIMRPVYESLDGHTRVLYNGQNAGFPRTVNRGAMQGKSPFILLLNSDVELGPGALAAMLSEFGDPKVGAVGPKLLFPDGSTDLHRPAGKVQHAGLGVNWQGQIIHLNLAWSADHPKVNERRIVQAVTGACLMTRREAWNKVAQVYRATGDPSGGAFNEVYGRGTYEDVEYCFAVRGNGYQVVYQPAAVAIHHTGASAKDTGGFPLRRNEMIFRARCGHMLAWDEWRFY